MAWNEAFTHLLKLPTSLQNHANMLDYKLSSASPCEGFISLYVPIPKSNSSTYTLTLKNGTKCSGNISYLVKDTYRITSSNTNPSVQKIDSITSETSDVDINIEIRDGNKFLVIPIQVWQISIYEFEEVFTDVVYKEFYDVNIAGIEDQFNSIHIGVYIKDDNYSEDRLVKFNEVASIYSATSKDKAYTFKYYGDGRGMIRFGNGIFGFQPKEKNIAKILVYATKGSGGVVYPGQLRLDVKLIDFYNNMTVETFGTNLSTINNGIDEQNIEVAKQNIISNISAAKRLVTQDDYLGFNGITGIRNLELYPMLLRRDTNVNEIDIFSVLYDTTGIPIPTTNLNYIIDENRNILSKDYTYVLAVKKGDNGVELVPNTLKIVNSSATDPDKHELYSALYVNSKFDNYDPIYSNYDEKIIYTYSDNIQEFVYPDELKEYVCPFNISIDKKENNKIGIFEYIPYTLSEVPKVEDNIDYVDIDMNLRNVFFDFIPTESMTLSNIKPTHINVINTMTISNSVSGDLVNATVVISQEGKETRRYPCKHKYISEDDNELQTTCMIPVTDLYDGEILFEYIVYYGDKYYNTYKKYLVFIDGEDRSFVNNYIGYPISFTYDPSDPRTMQTAPAIDKIYMGVTNVTIDWTSWKDKDGFNVDGYTVDVKVNKLAMVDINKIKCNFIIGYGNETFEADSLASFNDSSITYRFKIPYNPNFILDGSTYYKVQLLYKFNEDNGDPGIDFTPFISYSGFAIFRRRFSELMYCNIEKVDTYSGEAYKIYRIPVVEKSYYTTHKEYLENEIFYRLAQLDANTIDYKMLTDRMNFKFVKTSGAIENIKYNDRVTNIDDSLRYNGWTCDLPPTITLSILVDKNTTRTKQDIVNECKTVLLTFLEPQAKVNIKITRSEIARYIHDAIPEILSCEVIEPARDIIYFYDQNDLPKDKETVLSYTPEFVWFDASKFNIITKITPV